MRMAGPLRCHKMKSLLLLQVHPLRRLNPSTGTCTKVTSWNLHLRQILVSRPHQLPLVPMLGLYWMQGGRRGQWSQDATTALKELKDRRSRVRQGSNAGGRPEERDRKGGRGL